MIPRPVIFLPTGNMKTGSDGLLTKRIHGFIMLIWAGYTRTAIRKTIFGFTLSQWAGFGQAVKYLRTIPI